MTDSKKPTTTAHRFRRLREVADLVQIAHTGANEVRESFRRLSSTPPSDIAALLQQVIELESIARSAEVLAVEMQRQCQSMRVDIVLAQQGAETVTHMRTAPNPSPVPSSNPKPVSGSKSANRKRPAA